MAEYLECMTAIKFCGDLFTDPTVTLYKYFSLKRGIFRSLLRPFYTGFMTYGVKGVIEGIRLARETSHLAGDSWQQGGTILLDKEENILYQHVEEHPADWPSMEKVFRLVGIPDRAVNYKQALAEWLKMREENRAQS
ncbi:uncharacterized protein [Littorina saxatilis]|uniref:uncharacterized protein n=1 Tax=Littorina saxatilis TaxID=31220 RepID=UPI0038B5D90A